MKYIYTILLVVLISFSFIRSQVPNGGFENWTGGEPDFWITNNDDTLIVITYIDGKVELRKENGSLVRTIVSSKAKRARFQGSDIAVSMENGKIELRKENGSLIRTM